MVQVTTMTSR